MILAADCHGISMAISRQFFMKVSVMVSQKVCIDGQP
jgi:hypothetical protein